MRAMRRRIRRQVVYEFFKWLPVLGAAFFVLYVDAWLNTETRNNDYDLAQLNNQIRSLQEKINAVHAEEAYLEGIKRLAELASEMGMIEPQPQQIEVVRYSSSDRNIIADDIPKALAHLEQCVARIHKRPGLEEKAQSKNSEVEPMDIPVDDLPVSEPQVASSDGSTAVEPPGHSSVSPTDLMSAPQESPMVLMSSSPEEDESYVNNEQALDESVNSLLTKL